jgi:hypothetical protein
MNPEYFPSSYLSPVPTVLTEGKDGSKATFPRSSFFLLTCYKKKVTIRFSKPAYEKKENVQAYIRIPHLIPFATSLHS